MGRRRGRSQTPRARHANRQSDTEQAGDDETGNADERITECLWTDGGMHHHRGPDDHRADDDREAETVARTVPRASVSAVPFCAGEPNTHAG
jgi:hypothetical protein